MRILASLSRGIDRFVLAVGKTASLLFLPLTAVIVYDVIQRKAISVDSGFIDTPFYLSSTVLQELEWHLHGALFLLTLGFAYVKDAHVRIELLRDRFPPRRRMRMEALGILLLLLPYCWFVTTYGWGFAERAYLTAENSATNGIPDRWIVKAFVPVGFVLLGLAGLSVLLKCAVRLGGSREDVGEEGPLGIAPRDPGPSSAS
jgi:TRAP-type mannitol/chloroaromatic compound transport system permease small subunit